MTINQLKYVLSLNKHKNFTIAADNSLVSQPSLSTQIQKLEKELNTKIFDRSKKPIKTTELGEKLVKQFQIIVSESLKVKDLINYQKNKIVGNLNIGISSTLESTILPLFIDKLFVKFPDLNIKFIINKSDLLYDSLNSTEIELSDIDTNCILVTNKENEFRSLIENIFPSCNYNKKFENNSLETLVNLSLEGNGITLIPYLNYLKLRDQEKTKVYKFKAPEPAREISVIFKNNNLKKHIIEEMFLLLKSSFKKIQSFNDVKIINPKI